MPNLSSCNCAKGCNCPNGYKCCTESNNPARARPTLGVCCKDNANCDTRRGICKSGANLPTTSTREHYSVNIVEGYDDNDNCDNWKGAFWYLIAIIVLMLFCIVFMVQK